MILNFVISALVRRGYLFSAPEFSFVYSAYSIRRIRMAVSHLEQSLANRFVAVTISIVILTTKQCLRQVKCVREPVPHSVHGS